MQPDFLKTKHGAANLHVKLAHMGLTKHTLPKVLRVNRGAQSPEALDEFLIGRDAGNGVGIVLVALHAMEGGSRFVPLKALDQPFFFTARQVIETAVQKSAAEDGTDATEVACLQCAIHDISDDAAAKRFQFFLGAEMQSWDLPLNGPLQIPRKPRGANEEERAPVKLGLGITFVPKAAGDDPDGDSDNDSSAAGSIARGQRDDEGASEHSEDVADMPAPPLPPTGAPPPTVPPLPPRRAGDQGIVNIDRGRRASKCVLCEQRIPAGTLRCAARQRGKWYDVFCHPDCAMSGRMPREWLQPTISQLTEKTFDGEELVAATGVVLWAQDMLSPAV